MQDKHTGTQLFDSKETCHKVTPWWLNLMYSIPILLLIYGIPSTLIIAYWESKGSSEAASAYDWKLWGIIMVLAQAATAVVLYATAKLISAYRKR